jgi:ribulose-5-phosphate 4-epimerase/fuculose-1-phosphate aldolase
MDDIVDLSRKLSSYVVGSEGNVSLKLNDGNFLIKASGEKLADITKEHIVECNSSGVPISSNKKPSMEVFFHTWFQSFEDINVVIHTHPVNILKIVCSNKIQEFAENRLFPDQVVFNGKKSCVVDYALPGESLLIEIKKSVNQFKKLENVLPKVILLKNHGIICIGKTISETLTSMQIAEKSAEIFIGSSYMGRSYLMPDEIEKISKDPNEIYRKNLNENNIR